jgi:hypothetical protein
MVEDQVKAQELGDWSAGPELVRVSDLLRHASEVLDTLWWLALEGDSEGTAIRLGEASLQVHRALIALEANSDF